MKLTMLAKAGFYQEASEGFPRDCCLQLDDQEKRYENYGSSKQCWMKVLALLLNNPRLS